MLLSGSDMLVVGNFNLTAYLVKFSALFLGFLVIDKLVYFEWDISRFCYISIGLLRVLLLLSCTSSSLWLGCGNSLEWF